MSFFATTGLHHQPFIWRGWKKRAYEQKKYRDYVLNIRPQMPSWIPLKHRLLLSQRNNYKMINKAIWYAETHKCVFQTESGRQQDTPNTDTLILTRPLEEKGSASGEKVISEPMPAKERPTVNTSVSPPHNRSRSLLVTSAGLDHNNIVNEGEAL